ncbi:MAG: cupredoxin domain-containing protein [Rhodocyclales bacterium]|nr:cupredoxin domain-containing protein [Rhodocyclales bacterium]
MFVAGPYLKRVPGLLALVSACALGQQTVDVTIQDYKFLPPEVRIKAGDTVKWINRENRTSHSVLFPAESGLESERLFPGESWKRTFTVPGSHAYRCGPHEEMKGVVHVD